MATAKKGAKKSAALPKEPSASDVEQAFEEGTPLEPIGPGVEHEDHEGGLSDSLAKKGVRYIPNEEEREELGEEDEGVYRSPSVRERQTGMRAAVVQGGVRAARQRLTEDASKEEVQQFQAEQAERMGARPGAKGIPVVATRAGHYPAAGGRVRVPGEAFVYYLNENETKLPSWVRDPKGKVQSRRPGEANPDANPVSAVIEVRQGGDVRVRNV